MVSEKELEYENASLRAHNGQLLSELNDSDLLIHFFSELNRTNTAQEALDITYKTLESRFGKNLRNIALLRPKKQRMRLPQGETSTIDALVVQATAPNHTNLIGHRIPYGEGVTGRAARNRERVTLRDVSSATSKEYVQYEGGPTQGSEIAVPLLAQGEVIAVLEAQANTPFFFSSANEGLFSRFARGLGTKIEGIQIAERDDLCVESYKHQAFLRQQELEVMYAIKNGYNLCRTMIDLNDFKSVNDKAGHSAGDYAIKLFSTALLEAIRETDILGRVGGDEFATLKPDTDFRETEQVMARVIDYVQDRFLGDSDMRDILRHAGIPGTFSYGIGSIYHCADALGVKADELEVSPQIVASLSHKLSDEADKNLYVMKGKKK